MIQSTNLTQRPWSRAIPLIAPLVLYCSASGAAQTVKSPASVELRRASELTREADTEAELTRILEICEAADSRDNAATEKYRRKLTLWALTARGEQRQAHGQLSEALEDLDAALRIDPRHVEALRVRGACLAKLGRPDEALVDLDKAISVAPQDVKAHLERGQVRYALGRYAEAARDFDQVLKVKPRNATAVAGRGHARFRLRQFAGAAQDYSQALKAHPQDVSLFTQRGQAYAQLGRYTEAANDFRRAMRIDPNYGRAFQAAAWLMSTCPDPRHRDELLAIELAKRAIELDGKTSPKYLETLAAALANGGYFDEARQVQEKALESASATSLARSTARRDLFAAGRPYREPMVRR